jgi:hypothetical protein
MGVFVARERISTKSDSWQVCRTNLAAVDFCEMPLGFDLAS